MDDITTITIPIPQPFSRNFGVHATSYQGAERVMQRYSEADFKLIQEQAAKLEIKVSAFIKESALNMARALKAKEQFHAQQDIRDRR